MHEAIFETFTQNLQKAYKKLRIGNPLDKKNHVGPLIDIDSVNTYKTALSEVKKQGGTFLVEGGVLQGKAYESGCYVQPAVAIIYHDAPHSASRNFCTYTIHPKIQGKCLGGDCNSK